MENCIVTQSRLLIKQWSFGFIAISPLTRSKIHEKLFWIHTRVLFSAPRIKVNYFIAQLWQLLTASNVGARTRSMTGQVGGFQNPGVCLQAFPSFLPHPLRALLAPSYAQSLTLVVYYTAVFRVVTQHSSPLDDSRSSLFAPKLHRNACNAG